jgi:hypothetical protein
MTWTLVARRSWDLRLDGGGLLYTFDGERAWAIEPQGPRIISGEELVEARHLFPLPELFAPSCPEDAVTATLAVRFAETDCWKVTSSVAGAEGSRVLYFAVEDGRLVGSEGTGLSTIVFHDWQPIAGMTLPARVTRYRAEDGQQHEIVVTGAAWVETPDDLFAFPPSIQRLMRTPAELAEADKALREQFAGALARYQPRDKGTPLGDDVIELRVRDGDLWFATPAGDYRVRVEAAEGGTYPIDGLPLSFSIESGEDGRSTALKLILPGPPGTLIMHRLPE